MNKIAILGAAESGVGAAILAFKKGYDVFVSDMGLIKENYKNALNKHNIEWEEGTHTERRILDSDEIIKSPGIPDNAPIIAKAIEKGIRIINEIEFVHGINLFSFYNFKLKKIKNKWKQFSNIQCIGIDFLEIPYDATSFTEEERNSNPERIIYPATLEDKDSVDMICEQVGGDCIEAVDLGLSVKWATCNIGASSPEEYGDYFAWGETQPKDYYDWSTYKWCNGSSTTLTKYNNRSSYGTVDNKKTLELADDAARANWGGAWRMPTDAEMTELREQCTWTWTTLNGVNGYRVTGTNGNSIFLPAAGYRLGSSLGSAGSYGYYWSSSLRTDYPICAYFVYFGSSNVGRGYNNRRNIGNPVRPVCQ